MTVIIVMMMMINSRSSSIQQMKHQEIIGHPHNTAYSYYHVSVTTVYIQLCVHRCTYHSVVSCVYCRPCSC